MPRSRITVGLLIALSLNCQAQRDAAIDHFLVPILTASAADPNVEGWTWTTNGNGGYLVRKLMDVTGDGRPELFVASTLQSTKYEHRWHVFDVPEDGTFRPYRTVLEHSFAWPIVEGGQTQLVYVMPPDNERLRDSDERPYPVQRYKFAFPNIIDAQTYASEAEVAKLRPTGPSQLPKLQSILLADYLTNPNAKWSDVTGWKLDANDCLYRPEDKERSVSNTAFTPQIALSKLGGARPSPSSRSEQTTRSSKPGPELQPAPRKAPESKPTVPTPSEEAPWSIIVVLIVAVGGLVWLLIKRRS